MTKTSKRPTQPHLVLLSALILPGTGQVLNGQAPRGLLFLFFMFLLGGYTLKTAAPDVSLLGKLAGGVFVYAVSVLDAYRNARIRYEIWRYRNA